MKNQSGLENGSERVGMRGGTTTRTESGMCRKNLWISTEMNEALRRKAYEERRTESDVIREALGQLLGVEEG